MQNIGVVDAEYVIHYGLPTLGEPAGKKVRNGLTVFARGKFNFLL